MNQNELDSTEIIKLIADTFYITFLPVTDNWEEDKKNIDKYLGLLSKYIKDDVKLKACADSLQNLNYNIRYVFDRKKFISDAKTFTENEKEIYLSLLPGDLLGCDDKELDKIENAYEEIKKLSLKGGYIRAVLETLYDEKYKTEFNKLTEDFLEKAWKLKENFSFNLVLSFMKIALNDFNRKDYENHSWNYSEATHIKAIGSTKKGKVEKVDNPYSAYKVYAQGEYSKLRIGYEADPSLPLNEMLEKGFEATLTDNEKITYKTYRIDEKTKEKEEVIETCDMTPYEYIKNYKEPDSNDKNSQKLINDSEQNQKDKDKDKERRHAYTKRINERERNTLILDLQTEAINTILQRFNDYIPYDLNTEITKEKKDGTKEGITIRQEIFNQCKNIFFENRNEEKNLDKLDKYAAGSFLSKNETAFINRYFYYVADNSWYEDRRKFDEVTHWAFDSSWRMQEKAEALNQLIYSGNIQYHPRKNLYLTQTKTLKDVIEGLKFNPIWLGILQKFNSDEYQNPRYNNHFTKEGKSYIDTEEDELYSNIEKDYKEHELSPSAFYLLRLFDEQFHDSPGFLSTIYCFIKQLDSESELQLSKRNELKAAMHTLLKTKQEKDAFDSYLEEKALQAEGTSVSLEEIDDKFFMKGQSDKISEMKKEERIGTLKTHFFMQCLDKNRNYNGLRLIYNNRNGKTGKDDKNEEKLFTHKVRSGIYEKLSTIRY